MTDGEKEQGFQSIKDLRLLGRDIKKTIIIDNLKENFMSTCPSNGIEIESWYGEEMDDKELLKLIPFLKGLVDNEEKDVRKVIQLYRDDLSQYVVDFCNPLYNRPSRRSHLANGVDVDLAISA